MLFKISKCENEVEQLVGTIIDDFISGKSKKINDIDDMVGFVQHRLMMNLFDAKNDGLKFNQIRQNVINEFEIVKK